MQKSEFDDRLEWLTEERCPYGAVRGVFGASTVSALLDYVGQRRAAFEPGLVRSRRGGGRRVDPSLRHSLSMTDLGPFRPRIESVMRSIAPIALARLGLIEPKVEPQEF